MPGDPQLPLEEIAAWQNHLASIIAAEEAELPQKHLIAVCDCNEYIDLSRISILNYHYEPWMAKGLQSYFSLRKPLVFDETHTSDFEARRKEAWTHLMKGCAGYSFLDLFFTTDDPTGTGLVAIPDGHHYEGDIALWITAETVRRGDRHA